MLYTFVQIKSFVWIVKSKPLIFGEDVQLSCYGSTCQPNTIKKWIGGPNYKLLCYVGYTADSSKYEMEVNDTDADFGLMIKNIAVEDTFCRYTCACGLDQYTNTLDLEGVDFIYPPVVKYNMSALKEGTYQVDIQMTVYPLPKCYITYQGNVTILNITSSTTSGHQLRLYNVTINQTMDMEHYSCYGTLFLKCDVEHRIYTLINQSIDICTEKKDTNYSLFIHLIYIIVPVCLIIGVSLGCMHRHDLLNKKKCCKREPELNGSGTVGFSCNLISKYKGPEKQTQNKQSVNKLLVVFCCKKSNLQQQTNTLF